MYDRLFLWGSNPERSRNLKGVLTTHCRVLVGAVAAVVTAIATVGQRDTEIVVALELGLRAEPATRVLGHTANLVAHVLAVAGPVAAERHWDAVAGSALECVILRADEIIVSFC